MEGYWIVTFFSLYGISGTVGGVFNYLKNFFGNQFSQCYNITSACEFKFYFT